MFAVVGLIGAGAAAAFMGLGQDDTTKKKETKKKSLSEYDENVDYEKIIEERTKANSLILGRKKSGTRTID